MGMSRKAILFASLSVAAVLAVALAGVLLYNAPHRTVEKLRQAVQAGDTNALAQTVDFGAVRKSLTAQITAGITNKMARDADRSCLRVQ